MISSTIEGDAVFHAHSKMNAARLMQPGYTLVCNEVFSLPELERSSSVEFDSPSQKLSYSLQATIYSGGKHFTVHFRDQPGLWRNTMVR